MAITHFAAIFLGHFYLVIYKGTPLLLIYGVLELDERQRDHGGSSSSRSNASLQQRRLQDALLASS
jgi:hypothetical protein